MNFPQMTAPSVTDIPNGPKVFVMLYRFSCSCHEVVLIIWEGSWASFVFIGGGGGGGGGGGLCRHDYGNNKKKTNQFGIMVNLYDLDCFESCVHDHSWKIFLVNIEKTTTLL